MNGNFTSNQVIALTGITPRQLQWWDERGLVVPERDGRNRLYSMADVAELAVLCQLRKKGFSLQRVRKIMRYLQRELGQRLVETVTGGSEYHLLTDGKRIFLKKDQSEVVDILKNSRQPILGVCLTDAVREIHAEIEIKFPRLFTAGALPVKGKPRRKAAGAAQVHGQPYSQKRRAAAR